MESAEEKKGQGKDKGTATNPQQNEAGSSKKGQKAVEKTKEKKMGKCQMFIELLKSTPQGLDWDAVRQQKWNDRKAVYPGTFSKLRKENLAFKKDGKMFYGKPKPNGKAKPKAEVKEAKKPEAPKEGNGK